MKVNLLVGFCGLVSGSYERCEEGTEKGRRDGCHDGEQGGEGCENGIKECCCSERKEVRIVGARNFLAKKGGVCGGEGGEREEMERI